MEVAKGGHLLLVDDDARYLRSLKLLLQGERHVVRTAGSVADALGLLVDIEFDVVVLDLNMPSGHGTELLRHLGRDSRNIKAIVASAETQRDAMTAVLRLGANDYILKGSPPEQLLGSIANQIQRKRLEDENRRMQQRIEASDQLHRFLVNQSPDVIYMLDDAGCFSYLNSKVREVFGCDKEDLIGEHWTRLFEPAFVEMARYIFNERRSGERASRHAELRALPPGSNEQIYLEVTAMGVARSSVTDDRQFFGTYGVARDVTQRRLTEHALSQSQRQFFTLFQSSPDAIFISRLDTGELLEFNASFGDIARALAGMRERHAAPTSSHNAANEPRDATAERETDGFLWLNAAHRAAFASGLLRAPDRFRDEISLQVGPVEQHFELAARHIVVEEHDCMLGTLRDFTAQKAAERERITLEQQLQQAQKMEALGQLAGGIAHDFNNILASMIGYADLALMPDARITEQKRRGYLEQVIDAGQRARDLIAQLLSFSRTNRDHALQVELGEEIQQALKMLRAAIPTTIDIAYAGREEQLPAVLIDPVHLQQVLINLIVNAREAIDGVGRITISMQSGIASGICASCHATFGGRWVGFEVADTGCGIELGMLPRMFDRFVTSREPGQGTGIGLAVVHSIVHEYGGHLVVDSVPHAGTRFRILLPPSDAATHPESPSARAALGPMDARGRVLVVDDEASVGNMIAEALRFSGLEVLLFNDAADALACIEDAPGELDLIITDQTMPRMSGLELAARVKALPIAIPLLLVTGYQDTVRSRAVGVDRILLKPFNVLDLLAIAREMIADGQNRDAKRPREPTSGHEDVASDDELADSALADNKLID